MPRPKTPLRGFYNTFSTPRRVFPREVSGLARIHNTTSPTSTQFSVCRASRRAMKVSSALCALSFASWTIAAPMVMTFKHTPPKYSGPQITSLDTWPIRTSKFAIGHKDGAQDILNGRPDNSPYSPSSDVAPSEALAAPRPLKTSYLLAIKPFMLPAEDKTPEDKAPVPQSDFLESSTVKEETGSIMRHYPTTVELETEGNKPFYKKIPCVIHQGHFFLVRRYADTTVVSIVFILIALIAMIELWKPICST